MRLEEVDWLVLSAMHKREKAIQRRGDQRAWLAEEWASLETTNADAASADRRPPPMLLLLLSPRQAT